MNISEVTAAPMPVKVNGRELLLSPPTDSDYGEFEKWLQGKYIDVAIENLPKVPIEHRDGLLAAVFSKAAILTLQTDEGKAMSHTVDAEARLLWICFRRNHPDITYEEIRQLVTNPVILGDIMLKLAFLITGKNQKKKKEGKQKTTKKRR